MPDASGNAAEAKPLTKDYDGTSRRPFAWRDRVLFTTDRSGRMNLWSMRPDGTDLRQHTKHADFDIGGSSVHGDRAVYQFGPDLRLHDLSTGSDATLVIRLASDFDHMRERWVKDPIAAVSAMHLSAEGDHIVLTLRGRVFVVPVKQGRTVDIDRRGGIRYREATFMPDGKTLAAISDESGELELVTLPANGVGQATKRTSDGDTVRWRPYPSPDGKWIAHTDKRQRLWLFDVEKGTNRLVEENAIDQIDQIAWSPDSRWMAYVAPAANLARQIKLAPIDDGINGGATLLATTDRYDSYAPQWSADGKFLYFISDRSFESVVQSPWGPRQPEPFLAATGRIYQLTLKAGTRSPFQPDDEVHRATLLREKEEAKRKEEAAKSAESAAEKPAENATDKPADKPKVEVVIDAEGLATRIEPIPVPAANIAGTLLVSEDAIFWLVAPIVPEAGGEPGGSALMALVIGNEKPEPKMVAGGVRSAELSLNRKKLLLRKDRSAFVIDAKPAKAELEKPVDVSGISLSLMPREEWRAMMVDAWRLLRDHFYDRGMHGADWPAVRAKYEPWIARVRSREELSDVFQEMTGELSALHHFVSRGDLREGPDRITVASLSADIERDEAAGGWRVTFVPQTDPDAPTIRSPLSAPTVGVGVGDVIRAIDGVATLSVPHPSVLLRTKAGRQTLLSVLPKGATEPRDVIVVPVTSREDANIRYRAWEVARRRTVEELGRGAIGYVHLRAMGAEDFSDFVRDYYPVFNRQGLIIDVRDNRGGNIDSWILNRLIRQAWMYWNQHAGRQPLWNMQYAFRGHMIILCNEETASDGEAISEGFRRLGLGKVLGTRTWGGEIWLSSSNTLVDGGIATAGEFGVFDETGAWLIEGRGVEPDIVVDNPPHATFKGEDAQLSAAIRHLEELIAKDPRAIPPVPPAPVKAVPAVDPASAKP
jgi:tricorn protease